MSDNQLAQPAPKPELKFNQSGLIRPESLSEAVRYSDMLIASKLLPERFNTAASVLVGMQYALELNLKPLTALKNIAVVKGTPCLFGDLPLALCQGSGLLESIREYYLDKDGKEISVSNRNVTAEAFASVCLVKRRGDANVHETFFTLDDAKQAGLLNSPTWKSYPKRMLRYRARSQALKDKFADCLNGIGIAEYDHNVLPEDIESAQTQPRQGATAIDSSQEAAPMSLRDKLKLKAAEANGEVFDANFEEESHV